MRANSSISLFRRIEHALETIALGSTALETIHNAADFIADSFADDLGIKGGRIYAQDDGSYELVETFGDASRDPIGLRVWKTYPPFEQLLDVGSVVMRRDDPRLDQRLEADLRTREWFAAIAVADARYVLSFDVESAGDDHENVVATLNIIRLAINQKLREERMVAIMEDARLIQNSILPRHLPQPGDFEIAARTVAAEIVGGDFYDVITLDDNIFDVTIADATGHGLPAALQVRDVFTGLRIGLSREYKVTRTIQRLNRIIHRSRMATKFVSLFLAEISLDGTIIHCNAGHPPSLLVRADGAVELLRTGGMILGPNPDARYAIGIDSFNPGDLLVLYTDGITEATDENDEEYGRDRLTRAVRSARHLDPIAIVDRVFSDVDGFSSASPPIDDQTLVVVKRREADLEEIPRMMDLRPAVFFDLENFAHAELLRPGDPAWSALGQRLADYLEDRRDWEILVEIPAGVHLMGDRVAIAPGCRIEPGAVIVGPAILDEGVEIRTGAYIRQNVVLGAGSVVGAHSEVKGSILLPGAKAPHQAYVGDSILGRDVNLGAGTICSNVKNVGREVSFRAGGEVIHTGLRKFGAILGDGCKTGCNTVLNPGVLMGPGSVTYTNASVRSGYYPADTLIKVRQSQQLTEMRKLRR